MTISGSMKGQFAFFYYKTAQGFFPKFPAGTAADHIQSAQAPLPHEA